MKPQVILLAAGKSLRTWPISEKVFFRFFGKTILEHQINTILSSGLKKIYIVGNAENITRIKSICSQIPKGNFSFCIQKNLDDGQRGGILAAAKIVNQEEPILLVCSNDMVDTTVFKELLSQAIKTDSEIYLVGKKVDKYFPGGYLKTKEGNYVTHIVEKPKPGTEPGNMVTLLIHLYKNPKIIISKLKLQKKGDGYENVLQSLFDSGVKAEAVPYSGFWQAIKYPWHFLDIGAYFLEKLSKSFIHPSVKIAKNVVINGNVYISEGVKVLDFSVISGPVFIGKNTTLGNHTLVRNSLIGDKCVIGQGSEVSRSIIGNHCWTHQNYVGDSVFDENVSLGSGTKTGNLRLDENEIFSEINKEKIGSQREKFGCVIGKNVRIGINSSIMPGVKIGSENFIGAGIICEKDISDKKFTFQKSTAQSRDNKSETYIRKDF